VAKWSGKIGFAETVLGDDDVSRTTIVEKKYRGDVLQDTRKWDDSEKINGDITINNRISVVARDYMLTHLQYMRYVTWQGAKWRISNISVAFPRVILSIGELYNETEG
jgi:hypothetical protein